MSSSRVSVARPVSLAYEIQGSKGSVKFEMTRINELLYYLQRLRPEGSAATRSSRATPATAITRTSAAPMSRAIAYNEIMSIQAHDILTAITEDRKVDIDIAYGQYVDTVLEAMATSAREGRWVKVSEMQETVLIQTAYSLLFGAQAPDKRLFSFCRISYTRVP